LKKVGAGNRTQAALWAAHNMSAGAEACDAEMAWRSANPGARDVDLNIS
jgi:hypothetical protein